MISFNNHNSFKGVHYDGHRIKEIHSAMGKVWPEESPTPPTPTGYCEEYLTFVAQEDGKFKFSGSQTSNRISYSLDSGSTWTQPSSVTTTPAIQSGHTVMFKGNMGTIVNPSAKVGTFSSTANFSVEGNIMSLLYGDNFVNQTSLSGKDYVFGDLFNKCSGLTSAENLVLPATTLEHDCYYYMFGNCTNLVTAPKILPATTLSVSCYRYMFAYCPSLVTAPQLPAITLEDGCYDSMFYGCTSLTTAPELLATTLVDGCYNQMFGFCTNLNYIKCLATDISANNCTSTWVNAVAESGTFTKASSMTSWASGDNGIPDNWTIQDA